MTGRVGGIVRKRTERKCVLDQICRRRDHVQDEVATSNVVSQIAEQAAAERVVAEIQDDGAAIGVRMGFSQIFVGSAGKPI